MSIEATPVHRIVSAIYVHWICPMQNAKRALWERNNQHLWAKLCVLRQLLVLSTKLLVSQVFYSRFTYLLTRPISFAYLCPTSLVLRVSIYGALRRGLFRQRTLLAFLVRVDTWYLNFFGPFCAITETPDIRSTRKMNFAYLVSLVDLLRSFGTNACDVLKHPHRPRALNPHFKIVVYKKAANR